MTVDSQPDSKTRVRNRTKAAEKTQEQINQEKAMRVEKKMVIAKAIEDALEKVSEIIKDLANETGMSENEASEKLHLGGHVLKDRRSVNAYNAWLFCQSRVDDKRCKYIA
jgi:ribosome-binding protein aMBF1 (putative translation factor)